MKKILLILLACFWVSQAYAVDYTGSPTSYSMTSTGNVTGQCGLTFQPGLQFKFNRAEGSNLHFDVKMATGATMPVTVEFYIKESTGNNLGGLLCASHVHFSNWTAGSSSKSGVVAASFTSGTRYYVAQINLTSGSTTVRYYSNIVTVTATTPPANQAPTVTLQSVTNISATGAVLNGKVNPNGSATAYSFKYSRNTFSYTSVPVSPVDIGAGTSDVSVSQTLSGLLPNETYYYSLYATNSGGPFTTNVSSFTTLVGDAIQLYSAINIPANVIKGRSYPYSIEVVNNSASDWTGSFYLKDGDAVVADWQNKSIYESMGRTYKYEDERVTLDGTYQPNSTGTKTLTLYYQTNGTGSGTPVGSGGYSNPITVIVSASAPSVYTVTFNSNGGSTVASQQVTEGNKVTKPSDPTRSGYTFSGWYKDGTPWDFNKPVTSNMTLTAQWTQNIPTTPDIVMYTKIRDISSPLTVGQSVSFKAMVHNNNTNDWNIAFFLKDGDDNVWALGNYAPVSAQSNYSVEGTFSVPNKTGQRTWKLYYWIEGTPNGSPVSPGLQSNQVEVTVNPASAGTAPTITTGSLPSGTKGTFYQQQLAATGTTPINWSVYSGTLPNGLSLSNNGLISGTPTAKGTFTFQVRAANSAGSAVKEFNLPINDPVQQSLSYNGDPHYVMTEDFIIGGLTVGVQGGVSWTAEITHEVPANAQWFTVSTSSTNAGSQKIGPFTGNGLLYIHAKGANTSSSSRRAEITVSGKVNGEDVKYVTIVSQYQSADPPPTAIDLRLDQAMSFNGITQLTQNTVYTFTTRVENFGTEWIGDFILKKTGDGVTDEEVTRWTMPVRLGNKNEANLSWDYRPTTTGQKSFKLYYSTNSTGAHTAVSSGNYSNPITITVNPAASVAVSKVTINAPKTTLTINEDCQYTATVTPTNADQTVTWSSSAKDVVAVNTATGLIRALKVGSATITATSNADNSKKDSKVVTVSSQGLSFNGDQQVIDMTTNLTQGLHVSSQGGVSWSVSVIQETPESWVTVSASETPGTAKTIGSFTGNRGFYVHAKGKNGSSNERRARIAVSGTVNGTQVTYSTTVFQDPANETPSVKINPRLNDAEPDLYYFEANGDPSESGYALFLVQANSGLNWVITSDRGANSFIEVSTDNKVWRKMSSGNYSSNCVGTKTIYLKVNKNESFDNRNEILTAINMASNANATIRIIQNGKPRNENVTVKLTPEYLIFDAAGSATSTNSFEVIFENANTNIDFYLKVSDNGNWIHPKVVNGNVVEVSVDSWSNQQSDRNGKISIIPITKDPDLSYLSNKTYEVGVLQNKASTQEKKKSAFSGVISPSEASYDTRELALEFVAPFDFKIEKDADWFTITSIGNTMLPDDYDSQTISGTGKYNEKTGKYESTVVKIKVKPNISHDYRSAYIDISGDDNDYVVVPERIHISQYACPAKYEIMENKGVYKLVGYDCSVGSTEVKDIPDFITEIGDGVFKNCSEITSVDLKNIVHIGSEAFNGCTNLAHISIPITVKSIKSKAFQGLDALEAVTVYWNNEEDIVVAPDDVFDAWFFYNACKGNNCKRTLLVPNGTEKWYKEIVPWKNFIISPIIDGSYSARAAGFSNSSGSVSLSLNNSSYEQFTGSFEASTTPGIEFDAGSTLLSDALYDTHMLYIEPLSVNTWRFNIIPNNGVTTRNNSTDAYRDMIKIVYHIDQSLSSGASNPEITLSNILFYNDNAAYQKDEIKVAVTTIVDNEVIAGKGKLLYYPNPVDNTLTVQVPNPNGEKAVITLISLSGQLAFRTETNDAIHHVDVQSLKRGIYILQVVVGDERYTAKVIKK